MLCGIIVGSAIEAGQPPPLPGSIGVLGTTIAFPSFSRISGAYRVRLLRAPHGDKPATTEHAAGNDIFSGAAANDADGTYIRRLRWGPDPSLTGSSVAAGLAAFSVPADSRCDRSRAAREAQQRGDQGRVGSYTGPPAATSRRQR